MVVIVKFVVVIPSFNPNEALIKIVDELIINDVRKIIIVNDGSENKCNRIFSELRKRMECVVLRHKENRGKGVAIKTALNYYFNNLFTMYKGIVTMDCDSQHLVKDVIKVGKAVILEDKFVLGMRDFSLDNVPLRNELGNKITSWVFKKLYHVYLRDTQTGLRGIPNRLVRYLKKIDGDRFEYEINELIDLVKDKEEIYQVDIDTVYLKDSNKHSKFKVFRDSYNIYKVIFKRRK